MDWETENFNLVPGSYVYQSGRVIIGPGEFEKSFSLKIYDNEFWNIEAIQLIKLYK